MTNHLQYLLAVTLLAPCLTSPACRSRTAAFALCEQIKIGDSRDKVEESARLLHIPVSNGPGVRAPDGLRWIKEYNIRDVGLLRGISGCQVMYRGDVVDKKEHFAD